MFTPRYVKHSKLLVRHAQKYLRYKRDVMESAIYDELGGMIRRLRANLLDELQKQYVVTARAKGLPPLRTLFKYPLRMALNPFISDIGSLLPHVISGAAIVSVVMSLPTTGPMLLEALRSQDMYLAGSFLMFMSFLTVIGVFVSDLALAVLDPRIRLQAGRRQ